MSSIYPSQGNVEYKLKLLNPSPERFTRLVTQMKWRLLEGGGQAYYELGVADSGQLVGLPRKDLEQSLETLEMMAGEIGASVIVVKEIEVPASLVGRGMNVALGIPHRTPVPATTLGGTETCTTTETDTSATEDDDDLLTALGLDPTPTDASTDAELDSDPPTQPIAYRQTHFIDAARSHPERPTPQSSPAIHAFHPESELDGEALYHLDFEIEIASVYKPRPHRARPHPTAQSKYTKRGTPPKHKPKRLQRDGDADPATRAVEKRMKRDARRDQRRRALLAPDVDTDSNASGLCDLHGGLDPTSALTPADTTSSLVPLLANRHLHDSTKDLDDTSAVAVQDTVTTATAEPRLIVEALVVRKLALEEAFLDFGGFALEM
jgi:hypothetical protein